MQNYSFAHGRRNQAVRKELNCTLGNPACTVAAGL